MKRLLQLLCLFAFVALLPACKKPNVHDNVRPPDPYPERPVKNHRFDGGESDPYLNPGEAAGGGGEGGAAPAGGGE